MSNFTLIRTPKGEELVLVPKEEFESLLDDLDIARAQVIMERVRSGEEELYPSELVERLIIGGEQPVKVFREYRGMTQEELAHRAGTSKNYISQIENRRRRAGRKLQARLAEALGLDPEDLEDTAGE